MPNKIAIIADTQLYKRLYGRDETRNDWYKAFAKAFEEISARAKDIATVLILGDVMDSNEVGSSAAYVLQNTLQKFSDTGIPVGMILGNHDNERNSPYTWVEVSSLVNSHLVHLSPERPMPVKVDGKTIHIYGIDNGTRERISQDLRSLARPAENTPDGEPIENWLCLHQALKELAPYKFAWDVTADQIPDWYDRVFLGDFHNTAVHKDMTGREYIYPGSIETVSFNQTETPGFIIFDTQTNSWEHISTQQREYITYDIFNKSSQEILDEATELITASQRKYNARPVLRILYTEDSYGQYLVVADKLEVQVLKLFAVERNTDSSAEAQSMLYTGAISENGGLQSRESIIKALPELLSAMCTNVDERYIEDIQRIITAPEKIEDIRASRYPDAVYKKIQI